MAHHRFFGVALLCVLCVVTLAAAAAMTEAEAHAAGIAMQARQVKNMHRFREAILSNTKRAAAVGAAVPSSGSSSSVHAKTATLHLQDTARVCGTHQCYGCNKRVLHADVCPSGGQYTNNANLQTTYTSLPTTGVYAVEENGGQNKDTNPDSVDIGTAIASSGSSSLTIVNKNVINSTVFGQQPAVAMGIYMSAGTSTLENFGSISAQVAGEGTAAGVWMEGDISFMNHVGSKINGVGSLHADGILTYGGKVFMQNDGEVTSLCTGATIGNNRGLGHCFGMSHYTWANDAVVINNGVSISRVNGPTVNKDSMGPCAVCTWLSGSGSWRFINNGYMEASCNNCTSSGVYHGSSGGSTLLSQNNGFVVTRSTGGGWAWGYEDDDGRDTTMVNTGYISTTDGYGMFIFAPNNQSRIFLVNTGSVQGSMWGIGASGFNGEMIFKNYGSIRGPNENQWMSAGNLDGGTRRAVYMYGLPDLSTGGFTSSHDSNTLVFDLTGNLEQVNGQAASGTDLSKFNLGTSGNMVVSGKYYKWKGFTVSGTVSMQGTTTHCASGSEGTTITMGCTGTDVIVGFLFASYGQPTGGCGFFGRGSCHQLDSVDVLNALCLLRSGCSVNITEQQFVPYNRPCAGTKRLAAQYICGPNRLTTADFHLGSFPASVPAQCGSSQAEGDALALGCPAGQVITSVDFASYGTPSGSCASGFAASTCDANTTRDVFTSSCVGHNMCVLEGKNKVFGDPCPGIGKYLAAQVTCSGGNAVCGVSDENSALTLTCPSNKVIGSVDFASYGTPSGDCSSGFSKSSCDASNSVSIVQSQCAGKSSCTVQATNSVFGDPCSGTFKRLAVKAFCK